MKLYQQVRGSVMAALVATSLGMAENLKVLTYNIHGGKDINSVLNLKQTLATLKRIDADIGGLNEVDEYCERSEYSNITGLLRSELNLSALHAQAIPLPNKEGQAQGNYGLAAFAKKPLQVVEQFALPVPTNSEGRTALIVKTCEEHPIYFVTTHMPWEEGPEWDQVLINCLKKIERRLQEGNYYPAILTGDMNRKPDNSLIAYMRSQWTVCNDVNPQSTWPANNPEMQIDYIAFQPKNAFEVVRCETIDEKQASDHRPLLAELKLKQ